MNRRARARASTHSLLSPSNSLNPACGIAASLLPPPLKVYGPRLPGGKWQTAAAAAVNVFRDSLKETTPLHSTLWLRSSWSLARSLVVRSRRQRTLLKFMVFVSERDNSPAAISTVRPTDRASDGQAGAGVQPPKLTFVFPFSRFRERRRRQKQRSFYSTT